MYVWYVVRKYGVYVRLADMMVLSNDNTLPWSSLEAQLEGLEKREWGRLSIVARDWFEAHDESVASIPRA